MAVDVLIVRPTVAALPRGKLADSRLPKPWCAPHAVGAARASERVSPEVISDASNARGMQILKIVGPRSAEPCSRWLRLAKVRRLRAAAAPHGASKQGQEVHGAALRRRGRLREHWRRLAKARHVERVRLHGDSRAVGERVERHLQRVCPPYGSTHGRAGNDAGAGGRAGARRRPCRHAGADAAHGAVASQRQSCLRAHPIGRACASYPGRGGAKARRRRGGGTLPRLLQKLPRAYFLKRLRAEAGAGRMQARGGG